MNTMSVQRAILETIRKKDPIPKSELIEELDSFYASGTLYRNIRTLIDKKKIYENEHKELTFTEPIKAESWGILEALTTHMNPEQIELINAYANRDPQLQEFTSVIFENPKLINNLKLLNIYSTILLNLEAKGFHKAQEYRPRELNREHLQRDLEWLLEKLQ